MSFPYIVGQVPVYYNSYNTGRPYTKETDKNNRFISKYIDIPNEPLYPFGYGLSYSDFEYSEPELSKDKIKSGVTLIASIKIKNTGKYAGKEIIQLYIRDLYGSTVRPLLELKDFKKIYLEAGESEKVNFEIKEDKLSFYNLDNKYVVEPGEFKVFIGSSSADVVDCGKFLYSL